MENQKSKPIRVKIEEFYDTKLLAIIENDIKSGNTYIIKFDNGNEVDINDLESFNSFLKDRNIK